MSEAVKINIVIGWLKLINEFPQDYIAKKIVEALDEQK